MSFVTHTHRHEVGPRGDIMWLDIEGIGLVGPTTLIQTARGDERPVLHEVWVRNVRDTLLLIDELCESAVGGWNLTFDWFGIQRLQNVLRLLPMNRPPTAAGWLKVERKAVFGPCVKPRSALDVFLFARRGPWQSLMGRDDIRIRRVPVQLAYLLAKHLTSLVELDPIYFSRRKGGYEWTVDKESLEEDPNFPDVILRFGAAGGLKPLARHLLGVEADDFPLPENLYPEDSPLWDPFGCKWRHLLPAHIKYWATNRKARRYAANDINFTRGLWRHFGSPSHGDVDSILACQVGSSRWHGFAINQAKTERLLERCDKDKESAPRAPGTVRKQLLKYLSAAERLVVDNTRAETLEQISGTFDRGVWVGGWDDNVRARNFCRRVAVARTGEKVGDFCRKLLHTRRGHPDFRVIATLSNRMGGTGGLNWQAFPDVIKACLTLADRGYRLSGGDFWAFEVTLAAAVYRDAKLIADLMSGKKIHAIFASKMFKRKYEEIYDQTIEKAVDKEKYERGKRGFFSKMFGAQNQKLALTLGISEAQVEEGSADFERDYPGVGEARKRIEDGFCSMRQPGGVGTQVEWHEPSEFVDSLFGARRYFGLENKICKALFELGQSLPGEFRKLKIKVSRRAGRVQTPGGAVQSAVFGAAFNIQARAMRAAANHEIQASGATITKKLQADVWSLQPHGVHPWRVSIINEHDSLMCPNDVKESDMDDIVNGTVESFRETVPLIRIDWKHRLPSWGAK